MNDAATKVLTTWPPQDLAPAKRDVWQAMARGLRCRCPNCGEGKLFRGFLKVADQCPSCSEVFSHHRADDLPAYLVIVIVGHIVVPLLLAVETRYSPSAVLQMIVWPLITLALSLVMLQPVKGAVVAFQWALRMHGFDSNHVDDSQHMRPGH